jgi:four helix bundle protein
MGTFEDLRAYQLAFELACEIQKISLSYPSHERYSLVDQIRRSSRSVCSNFAEAYRKRSYPKHFISKLSDADSENTETGICLDFSLRFNYINDSQYKILKENCNAVGRILNFMMANPTKFIYEKNKPEL